MAWHTSWISASRTSHREAMGKAVAKYLHASRIAAAVPPTKSRRSRSAATNLDSRESNPVEAKASCRAAPTTATWADASSCPVGR